MAAEAEKAMVYGLRYTHPYLIPFLPSSSPTESLDHGDTCTSPAGRMYVFTLSHAITRHMCWLT